MKKIVLVSASKARFDLLQQLGFQIITAPMDADELHSSDISPEELTVHNAELKLEAYIRSGETEPADLYLSADTVIHKEGETIGKPASEDHAREILEYLSGGSHSVVTGSSLYDVKTETFYSIVDSTEVQFRELEKGDISWYLSTGEWEGAAGAYRIQGAGECLIKKINGSFSNVMGLPIHKVYDILRTIGLI